MKKNRSTRAELVAIGASLLVVIIQAVDIVGQKARLPVVLTIIFGAFIAGVSAGRFVQKLRDARSARMAGASAGTS